MAFEWPNNFYSDGIHAQLRRNPTKPDFGWLVSDKPAQVAGVFTRNTFPAAPVQINRNLVATGKTVRAVVVNSANANSFTGVQGLKNAQATQMLAAQKLGVQADDILVVSTGIIGQQLPMDKISAGLEQLSTSDPMNFAKAILTTDLVTKTAQLQVGDYQISGVAKGSGMIHPNMGTMLAFIATDATISHTTLQNLLRELVDVTFNQITVDGDTSTNDTVLILANGDDWDNELVADTPAFETFKIGLQQVLENLAIQIARDGEGASRLIDVTAYGAPSAAIARKMAKAVVGSNLVKAAVFGADPNWGRIVDALGNVGIQLAPEKLSIWINAVPVVINGVIRLDLQPAAQVMQQDTIKITIDLAAGKAQGQAWGSDLTYEYVQINAAYHT
ncbi:MAG TPA: bifunctional glutamate N-acetyltransferase/amino-acid acetyltransferase ArgJ [Lactobacillaceae bacterium]|jgi:glutamate N-acetyltransferase/amino-acid N-acetyltransferase